MLDLDATADPLHGDPQGRFFHGDHDCDCYLPLQVFAGEYLPAARLRTAGRDGAEGSLEELERIVPRIREAWPQTRIIVRADSGFCRDWLMRGCAAQGGEGVLGMANNSRWVAAIEEELKEARLENERTARAARDLKSFEPRTLDGWSRPRRGVGKAEHLECGSNPRFVATSLGEQGWAARKLYEESWCARGDVESRIKDAAARYSSRTARAAT